MTNEQNEHCACCGVLLELPGTELCLACFAAGVPFPSRAADVAQTILKCGEPSAEFIEQKNFLLTLVDRIVARVEEIERRENEREHRSDVNTELLEACRAFVEWYKVSRWISGDDAFAIAQRAIAKAEREHDRP